MPLIKASHSFVTGIDLEIQCRAPEGLAFSYDRAKELCPDSRVPEFRIDIEFLKPGRSATVFQCPDERYIRDSSAPAIKVSNQNQATTRILNNTANCCTKLRLGYLDMVLPQLYGEQPENVVKVLRKASDYVCFCLH